MVFRTANEPTLMGWVQVSVGESHYGTSIRTLDTMTLSPPAAFMIGMRVGTLAHSAAIVTETPPWCRGDTVGAVMLCILVWCRKRERE